MDEREREEIIQYSKGEASFYDWNRSRYETVGGFDFLPYLRKHLDGVQSLLDVGCGDGHTLDIISREVDTAFGLEYDLEHCRKAREKNRNNDNVRIVEADVYEPFPFSKNFDLIITERGPINEKNIDLVRKNMNDNGVLLVEVIGEQDERVFKEIMGHGQGYGEWDGKSRSSKAKEMLEEKGLEPLYAHNHFYFNYYRDIVGLFKNHMCTPAIEFEGVEKELEGLEEVEKRLKREKGIKILRHRVVYAGRKDEG